MAADKPKSVSWHCNRCGDKTKHILRASFDQSYSDPGQEGSGHYQTLECAGCEEVSFRQLFWNSEVDMEDQHQRNDNDGLGPGYREYRLPPKNQRTEPKWLSEITLDYRGDERAALREIVVVLRETYAAFSAELPKLTAMGARAALDLLMTHQVSDAGGFSAKLVLMWQKDKITGADRRVLEQLIEVGHASTHRGYTPTMEDLDSILICVENVLQRLYILPGKSAKSSAKVPPRQKTKPSKP